MDPAIISLLIKAGLTIFEHQRAKAEAAGEGYSDELIEIENELRKALVEQAHTPIDSGDA